MRRPSSSKHRRPIAFVRKQGLATIETMYRGSQTWIVKDPVSLKFHRLGEAEKLVWDMLDGDTTYAQIRSRLQAQYPSMAVKLESIFGLIRTFHEQEIVESLNSESFRLIEERRDKQRKDKLKQTASSILWIRLPGFDPEQFLDYLYPRCRFLFSKSFLILFLLTLTATIVISLWNADELRHRIPQLHEYYSVSRLAWIPLVLVITKTVHEFGHALCCKHFGGECHEIGVMLLFFSPTMYCDASDSWSFKSKWHRIAVAAAGLYFELILVIIGFWVWWKFPPSPLHYICFLVLVLSGGFSLFFNLNPLMRFDGYYMLSDFLEIPNLQSTAARVFWSKFRQFCLGISPDPWVRRQFESSGPTLLLFHTAAFAYRMVVITGITWMILLTLPQRGLQGASHLLAASILFGLVGGPAFKVYKFFSTLSITRTVNWILVVFWGVVACLFCSLLIVPLPRSIRLPAAMELLDPTETIYVETTGMLTAPSVRPGDQVTAGTTIATLSNSDLSLAETRLSGELKMAERELEVLNAQRITFSDSDAKIPRAKERVRDLRGQLEIVCQQVDGLRLVATREGVVYPSSAAIPSPVDPTLERSWIGRPTDKENCGALFDRGTEFCRIATPEDLAILLMVDEKQVRRIRNGAVLHLILDELPTQLSARVTEISTSPVETVLTCLRIDQGGPVPCQPAHPSRPANVLYEVTAKLDRGPHSDELIPGMSGWAAVKIADESILHRVYKGISEWLVNM